MILHLSSAGSDPIELHIHDGTEVSIHYPGPGKMAPATNLMGATRLVPRLVALALAGVFGIAIGSAFAPRIFGGPSRVPGLAPPALAAMPVVPSNIPLAPHSRVDEAAARPIAPSPDMPEAVTRQLAQPPVVTPAPAQPRSAPSGSAFGLEN